MLRVRYAIKMRAGPGRAGQGGGNQDDRLRCSNQATPWVGIGNSEPAMSEAGWQVYILRCADDSLYTGIARDLPRRLRQHNGELVGGPKYTRGRRPVTLLWSLAVDGRSAALQQEIAIKRLSRQAKLELVSR